MRDRPFALFGAVGALTVQAAGLCIASVLAAMDTASGQSYQLGSGIALTVIGFCTVAAVAWVAVGVAQARRWSWTPAMLIQLFTLIVGIYLLQSHRYEWGVPAVALAAVAGLLLLLPRSLDALGRKPPPAEDQPAPAGARAARAAPGTTRPSRPRSGRP
jgi:hypothetical protein